MPMSECTRDDLRDLLPLLASGGTGPAAADAEAHVAECGACREELALILASRRALMQVPAIDIARIARAVPAYRDAAPGEAKVVPIASRRRVARVWRIAAAALIVVAGGTALVARQAADDTGPGAVAETGAGDQLPANVSGPNGAPLAADPVIAVGEPPASPTVAAETGAQMTFGGGLDDLSEDELVAILAALDDEEDVVPADPDSAFPAMSLDGEEEI